MSVSYILQWNAHPPCGRVNLNWQHNICAINHLQCHFLRGRMGRRMIQPQTFLPHLLVLPIIPWLCPTFSLFHERSFCWLIPPIRWFMGGLLTIFVWIPRGGKTPSLLSWWVLFVIWDDTSKGWPNSLWCDSGHRLCLDPLGGNLSSEEAPIRVGNVWHLQSVHLLEWVMFGTYNRTNKSVVGLKTQLNTLKEKLN